MIRLSLFFAILAFSCKAQQSPVLTASNEGLSNLNFKDSVDFKNATKGFIATRKDPLIINSKGQVAKNLNEFNFIKGQAPTSVNPSLWRQSKLNALHGLFKVSDDIYQVRGFDIANLTVVATNTGWIVIDPLTTKETAKAAIELINEQLGYRPVKAVLITHSHIDHYGGIKGITSGNDNIEIIAPEGFYESSISENVIAGNAMKRRAMYMFGYMLPSNAENFVGTGLGQNLGIGNIDILRPTIDINKTGQTLTIDGLEIEFINTPEAEAPAECMFYFPKYRAICQAENVNHTLHNLYTLRGAKVRDGNKWAKYLDKAMLIYGDKVDISFGSHHWPVWGKENINELWKKQRDAYKFIHDQTLYLANKGLTPLEIADTLALPASLDSYFANRGYYGTISHNVKAQYQLYFGWFDGNPANLNPLPPAKEAIKYVEYMGGAANVIKNVKKDIANKEFRWAASVLNQVVFADPTNMEAKQLLAEVYTQLGYDAESGPWRNFYLTGAQELKEGNITKHMSGVSVRNDMAVGLTLEMYYDYLAVKLDPAKTAGKTFTFNMVFPDSEEKLTLHLINQVLHNRIGVLSENPDATITLNKSVFYQLLSKQKTGAEAFKAGEIKIDGNAKAYGEFQQMATDFELLFNIVEP